MNPLKKQFSRFRLIKDRLIKKNPKQIENQESSITKRKPSNESVDEILKKSSSLSNKNRQELSVFFDKLVNNPDLLDLFNKMKTKLPEMKRGEVRKVWDKVKLLSEMIKDNDNKVSWKRRAYAIAALVYLISPIDIIPDFIPFAGLSDDVVVIVAICSLLHAELKEYMTDNKEDISEAHSNIFFTSFWKKCKKIINRNILNVKKKLKDISERILSEIYNLFIQVNNNIIRNCIIIVLAICLIIMIIEFFVGIFVRVILF